ncbi:MAG: PAS domain S-box protein [Mariprofundales bacterium]
MNTEEKRKKAGQRFAKLEQQAENIIASKPDSISDEVLCDTKALIHQLRVYQAELEIQNDELREAQEELLNSRDRFSMLFEQAPVGYVSINKGGFIREVNHKIAGMLNLPIDRLINQPMVNFIHPADRDVYLGRFRAVFEQPEGKHMEIRLDCANHSTCYARFEWRATVYQSSAEPVILLTIHDVTARKQAEKKLHLAHSALASTIEGVIITDCKNVIVDVNRAFERVTGYSREEAVGQQPNLLSSGRQRPEFYQKLWQCLQDEGKWQGKIWNRRKNGEVYPEHLSITAIKGSNGEVVNHVGVFSDITEQLSLEEQLLQSQKMEAIGVLVGGIAHDFNNMLGGITGNLFLAKGKAKDQPALLKHLNNIEDLAKQSATMVAQMLAFARKDRVEMEQLSLHPFLNDVLSLSQVSLPENIRFSFEIDQSQPLMVRGDAVQLQQVMMNLLNNARDAVMDTANPHITLAVTEYHADADFHRNNPELNADDFVHLSLKDNGYGIAKAHLSQVFEPFFSTKEVGKGTGLGLAMCYGTLKSHNGVISVESQLGVGTTFHIYLPLQSGAQQQSVSDAVDGVAAAVTVVADGKWILLADDAERVREPCAEVLMDIGYTVLQAEDGKEALALFQAHQAEIVLAILDVVMPHCGGVELAQKLRAINPKLPIIFATGYDKQSVLDPQHPMKNCKVLTKPYAFDHLADVIQQQVAKYCMK